MARTRMSFVTSWLAIAAYIVIPMAASAQMNDARKLDIEEQPLSDALKTVADEFGLQIAFFSESTDGLQAEPLVGTYTPDQAFDVLLADTALVHTQLDNGTVVVQLGAEIEGIRPGKSRPASSPVLMAQNQASAPRNQTNETDETDEANDDDDERRTPPNMEEILVTGSRIRGAQNASPVVTITRQDIAQGGFATVEEIVQALPQNFGAGATQDTFTDLDSASVAVGGGVANIAAGTSVNLRGLGASSTLILLNGRRMSPSGATARFTDISGIPVTAIDRVEVLTDGASAIYGADAIGGVVNIILRDDYEGAETRLRYGSDTGGDTSDVLFGQSFGKSWDGGNVLFSYEYYKHDKLANGDRELTSTTDLSRFGGSDWRSVGGNPANIDAGGELWAIPAGQDGTALTAADFPVDANGVPIVPPNRLSNTAARSVLPEQNRHSAFLHLSQEIGAVELLAEARFSTRDFESVIGGEVVDINVPGDDPLTAEVIEGNPFFVDPTGTGLTTVEVTNYSLLDDFGPSTRSGGADHYGAVLGVRFDIGNEWNGELVGDWSKEESEDFRNNRLVDTAALDAAVNQTDANLAFNPFGDGSNTNPAVLDTIRASLVDVQINAAENELWSVGFHVDGEVFDLPGGRVQLATGVEFREEALFLVLDPGPQESITDLSRDILAVYAELFFPLVNDSNSRVGVQRLEFSLAGRHETYSDFGHSTDPKVGLVWSPSQSLTLRGTYGTSFRAPALNQLDVSNLALNSFLYFPETPFVTPTGLLPFPAFVLVGANENLRPEQATTWTAGFQWDSERAKGLSLDVTYFNVDFDDRIEIPAVNLATAFSDPRFSSLVTLTPTNEQIAALVNDPRFDDSFGTSAEDILSGVAPVGGILSVQRNNLARSVVTGLDVQLSYDFETALGSFDVGLNGSYLFDFERQFIATDPIVEEVDTSGRPVDCRARGNVTWSRQRWSANGYINYIDGYTDNISDPARPIDSFTTVDLTISYDTGDATAYGWLSDVELSLTVQNLFDEGPPFVDTVGGLGYDSANHGILGRFLSVQATKEW